MSAPLETKYFCCKTDNLHLLPAIKTHDYAPSTAGASFLREALQS